MVQPSSRGYGGQSRLKGFRKKYSIYKESTFAEGTAYNVRRWQTKTDNVR